LGYELPGGFQDIVMNTMNTLSFFGFIARRLRTDRARARTLTGIVFRELRDRLTPGLAAGIATRLPPGLQRVWTVNPQPLAERSQPYKLEFLGEVMQQGMLRDSTEAEHVVIGVFATLQCVLAENPGREGSIVGLPHQLEPDLAILWHQATLAAVPGMDRGPLRLDPRRVQPPTRQDPIVPRSA